MTLTSQCAHGSYRFRELSFGQLRPKNPISRTAQACQDVAVFNEFAVDGGGLDFYVRARFVRSVGAYLGGGQPHALDGLTSGSTELLGKLWLFMAIFGYIHGYA